MAVPTNPYASPQTTSDLPERWAISDDELSTLLVDESSSRHEVFGDIGDVNLYGAKHRRKIAGSPAERMTRAGLYPDVYQSVEWWCFVFVPIVPIGTRIVAMYREGLPDGDDHGRSIPTTMDWAQASIHAIVGILGLGVTALVLYAAFQAT